MQRAEARAERQAVFNGTKHISERKTKVIGDTVYSVGIAYKDNGETLSKLLLQRMKEKQ